MIKKQRNKQKDKKKKSHQDRNDLNFTKTLQTPTAAMIPMVKDQMLFPQDWEPDKDVHLLLYHYLT